MQPKTDKEQLTLMFIFIASIAAITFQIPRENSLWLMIAYSCSFMAFAWLNYKPAPFQLMFSLGILCRIGLFFSTPSLSDDYFRFLWDGALLDLGMDPYAATPQSLWPGLTIDQQNSLQVIYENLNSAHYYSIYPPLNQLLFWLAYVIGQNNLLIALAVLRIPILLADLLSFNLIRQLLKFHKKHENLAWWYFLNPLLIIEGTGNLHFEPLVIAFILLSICFWYRERQTASATSIALAIGTKLTPALFAPLLIWKLGMRQKIPFILALGLITFICFVPIFNTALVGGMSTSLNLYFQKFEFNASIYFFIREIGFWLKGYNIIQNLGPALALISGSSILLIYLRSKSMKIEGIMTIAYTLYLLFSTTVHPWYILLLIPLGLVSGFWFPLIWSFTCIFSYMGYNPSGYTLPVWATVMEYLLVFITLFLERKKIADLFALKPNNIKIIEQ